MRRTVAALFLLALAAPPASPQPPSTDWLTYRTPSFRLHCPAASRAWCDRLVTRIEPAWDAVTRAVGYRPPPGIDLVVSDPAAAANGSAWPLLASPRVVLWSTPPSAGSSLGHFGDWGELVLVHELVHLAHLLRPSRAPLRALAERTVWPLGPLATRTPRWAIEGYATLLEGRLTGSGRPHGAFRDVVVERFARAGRLPGYAALSGGDDGFLGRSMAYLVGSTYLEWLEARAGDDALARVWRRGTARRERNFDEAFRGVFGEEPRALYARFVAERTAQALAGERAAAAGARRGELYVDLVGATGALALDAAGDRLAYVERRRRRPPRLVVLATAIDDAERAQRDERRRRLLARDPEDVPGLEVAPPPRRRLATLEAPPGCDFAGARFLADGSGLLFARSTRGADGDLALDLYRYRFADAREERLTRAAALGQPDPTPDGLGAFAVERRHGASALVRVDLASGAVERLEGADVERLFDQPRVAPDGLRLAYLEHRDGRWRVRLRDLASGASRTLELPHGGEPTHLTWRPDGSHLYVSVARAGAIEIEALPVATGAAWHQVTHDALGAFAPATAGSGEQLYFLRLDLDGLDIARLDLDAATPQPARTLAAPLAATASIAAAGAPSAGTESASPQPYGLGRLELQTLVAGSGGNDSGVLEAGLGASDLLGRYELQALAGTGDEGPRGFRLAFGTRRLPLGLGLQVARVELASGTTEPRQLRGIELVARDRLARGSTRLDWSLGLSRSGARGRGDDATRARLELEVGRRFARGALSGELVARGDWTARLSGAGDDDVAGGALALALAARGGALRLAVERHEALDRGGALVLGGVAGSLLPPAFAPGRLPHVALAEQSLIGERLARARVALGLARSPFELFAERLDAGGRRRVDLAGLEARVALEAMPFLRLPHLEARLGVAHASGAAAPDDSLRWWLALALPAAPAAPLRRF